MVIHLTGGEATEARRGYGIRGTIEAPDEDVLRLACKTVRCMEEVRRHPLRP